MMLTIRIFVLLLTMHITAISGQAADILTYAFSGASPLAPTTVDSNATATDVNFTGSSASQFALANYLAINVPVNTTNAATAVSNASYFQFGITPNAGFKIQMAELSFQGATGVSPSSNIGYVLRSSLDGFASDIQFGNVPTQFASFTTFTVNLSGSSFQNLATQTTFRLYTWNGSSSNPALAYDNVVLRGTLTTVPEPGTVALIGVAIPVLAFTARKNRLRAKASTVKQSAESVAPIL